MASIGLSSLVPRAVVFRRVSFGRLRRRSRLDIRSREIEDGWWRIGFHSQDWDRFWVVRLTLASTLIGARRAKSRTRSISSLLRFRHWDHLLRFFSTNPPKSSVQMERGSI